MKYCGKKHGRIVSNIIYKSNLEQKTSTMFVQLNDAFYFV